MRAPKEVLPGSKSDGGGSKPIVRAARIGRAAAQKGPGADKQRPGKQVNRKLPMLEEGKVKAWVNGGKSYK